MSGSIFRPEEPCSRGQRRSASVSDVQHLEREEVPLVSSKWGSEGNLGFAQFSDDQSVQPEVCVKGKAVGRRVKFVYVSPVDKHSYRQRFQKNNAAHSPPILRKNSRLSSSLSNLSCQNPMRPFAQLRNNTFQKKNQVQSSQCLLKDSRLSSSLSNLSYPNRMGPSAPLRNAHVSNITRFINQLIERRRDGVKRTNPFLKVHHFLNRHGYPASEMVAINAHGGIAKVSGIQFFKITSFITDFMDSRYFQKVWEVQERTQQTKMLRDIVLRLARDLGLLNMRHSYIITPMVNKTVFGDFFSALLDRVVQNPQ